MYEQLAWADKNNIAYVIAILRKMIVKEEF